MSYYDWYESRIFDRTDRLHEQITDIYYPTNVSRKRNSNMAKNTIVFVKSTLYWFKGLNRGQAVQNYDQNGYEWTFEAEPHDIKFLKENGLLDRLKDPNAYVSKLKKLIKTEDSPSKLEELEAKLKKAEEQAEGRGDYLLIRKPTETKDGEPTEPFRIYDEDSEPWDRDTLIGNGTKADLKLKIVDWGPGKKSSIYCLAIRVTDHVAYESDEFAAMDDEESSDTAPKRETKTKAKTSPKNKKAEYLEELDDDDIPF